MLKMSNGGTRLLCQSVLGYGVEYDISDGELVQLIQEENRVTDAERITNTDSEQWMLGDDPIALRFQR
jgi:hypothetical protein